MSKYYKAEDVINAIEDKIAEYIPTLYGRYAEIPLELRMAIEHLPTIEVSEEVLKATKNFNAYTIADENAEMGMRTQIEPIIEVSEDCISREWLLNGLSKMADDWVINNAVQHGVYEAHDFVKNAPSVVPSITEDRDTQVLDNWQVPPGHICHARQGHAYGGDVQPGAKTENTAGCHQ